jgi:D-alanyl-D-alanine carboxypeptidase
LLLKGWSGVKTGQTGAAGGCLCSLKEGIFIIVLNSESAETRFTDIEKIFNWYKEQSAGQRKDIR